jgi:hypothetical protein
MIPLPRMLDLHVAVRPCGVDTVYPTDNCGKPLRGKAQPRDPH